MGIVVTDLIKTFGAPPIEVLKTLSFKIDQGEFISLTGRSGSGKSTLLYILSTLDASSSGTVTIDDFEIKSIGTKKLHQFRNELMGFVFQFHYLIPELSCEENILFPARKTRRHESLRASAKELMEIFEIDLLAKKSPGEISGGERQRVAIARAIIMKPRYLFADEPTGNLDSVSGEKVIKIFEAINRRDKTTIVMVTHDQAYASRANRQIGLIDGKIEFDRRLNTQV